MTRTLPSSSPGAWCGAVLALVTVILEVGCGFEPQPKSGTVACRPQGGDCCPEGYLCVGRGLPTAGGPSAGTCFRRDELPPEALVGAHDYTPGVLGDPACLVTDWLPPELIGIGMKADAGTPSQPDAISASWVDAGPDAGRKPPPPPVGSPPTLVAGPNSTYLVLKGKLLSWGKNYDGQLGDGTMTDRAHPVQVQGLETGVTTVSGGYDSACAVVKGGVQCWGWNVFGQLGDGSSKDRRPVPGPVDGLGAGAGATAVASGQEATCAVAKGAVSCWGLFGETNYGVFTPVPVAGLQSGVSLITAGCYHFCALVGGAVRCWGQNPHGQLGDGTLKTNWTNPVRVVGLDSGVTAIAAGCTFSCAVVSGQARCWGDNNYGQLGDGTTKDKTTPVAVVGISENVIDIAGGAIHACAVVDTGTGDGGGVRCWGANQSAQLGVDLGPYDIDNCTETPLQVTGLTSGVLRVTGGQAHSCARTADGVKCWGLNDSGQLGVEGIGGSMAPVDVKLP
jgi:alpha-tubulin suppressor-like RCC1 family protein